MPGPGLSDVVRTIREAFYSWPDAHHHELTTREPTEEPMNVATPALGCADDDLSAQEIAQLDAVINAGSRTAEDSYVPESVLQADSLQATARLFGPRSDDGMSWC
jgi:hypothetical protein